MSTPARGTGRPRRGRGGVSAVVPAPTRDLEESDEVRQLRAKYSDKLATAKELFPDWTDEDVLFAINEANGDVEVAIVRMSEGLAQQWGAVKTKKDKKVEKAAAAPSVPVASLPSRGGFAARGRGGFEGARGGRGGARGGRGGRGGAVGVNGVPRGAAAGVASAAQTQVNGASDVNSVTPSSFVPAPTPTGVWGKPVADATTAADTSSSTPSNWADAANAQAAAAQEAPAPAHQEEAPQVNGEAAPAPAAAAAPSEPAPKAAPRTIAPGSKMSWAQIARPPSPPKPAPPPPAPVTAPAPAAPSAPAPTAAPSAPEAAPEPVSASVLEETSTAGPTISLPTPSAAETAAPAPAAAPSAPAYDPWGSTPAAAAPQTAPLAVGEGWADSVLASKPAAEQDPAFKREVDAHLPPNDITTAGPLEVNSQVAQAAAPAQQQQAQAVQQPAQDKFLGAGPPGLPPKRAQQEAVVFPGAAGIDRLGVQFGSLDLLDGSKPSFGSQDVAKPETAAPQVPEQPSYAQQQQAPYQQQQAVQTEQPQQQQPQQAQQIPQQPKQEQVVQTAFSHSAPTHVEPLPRPGVVGLLALPEHAFGVRPASAAAAGSRRVRPGRPVGLRRVQASRVEPRRSGRLVALLPAPGVALACSRDSGSCRRCVAESLRRVQLDPPAAGSRSAVRLAGDRLLEPLRSGLDALDGLLRRLRPARRARLGLPGSVALADPPRGLDLAGCAGRFADRPSPPAATAAAAPGPAGRRRQLLRHEPVRRRRVQPVRRLLRLQPVPAAGPAQLLGAPGAVRVRRVRRCPAASADSAALRRAPAAAGCGRRRAAAGPAGRAAAAAAGCRRWPAAAAATAGRYRPQQGRRRWRVPAVRVVRPAAGSAVGLRRLRQREGL
ncbi:RHTO0S03e10660g1_1 [Rhodotorula toruloides]|uniref:RNA polymerase II degradation factor 1 n=1 Tax=Rhodotorula toruloides TaxID=5286 RepID=A0A061AT76_RHOTO|nr:RHTO0S03e10660g1_1 [Rhodotorula toruloides]